MRAVVQRVLNAGVTVDGECVGRIGRGYLVLLGVGHGDTRAEADKLWGKLRGLRINEDENGKTNLALADVDGEVLVVSQFTLFADVSQGEPAELRRRGQAGTCRHHVDQIQRGAALRGRCSTRGAFRRPYARRPGQRRPGHDRHRHRRPPLIGRAAAAPSPCEGTVPRDGARDATRATRAEYCRVRVGSRICETRPTGCRS